MKAFWLLLSATLIVPQAIAGEKISIGMNAGAETYFTDCVILKNLMGKTSNWAAADLATKKDTTASMRLRRDGYPVPVKGTLYSFFVGLNTQYGLYLGDYVIVWEG